MLVEAIRARALQLRVSRYAGVLDRPLELGWGTGWSVHVLRLLAVMRTSSTTWAARSGTCSRSASHRAFGCAEHGAFSAVETTSGLWKLNVGFSPTGLGMRKYSVR